MGREIGYTLTVEVCLHLWYLPFVQATSYMMIACVGFDIIESERLQMNLDIAFFVYMSGHPVLNKE